MAHLLRKVKTAFINDFKSGMKTKDLVSKYNFPSERAVHYMVYYFRKKGLLPKVKSKNPSVKTIKAVKASKMVETTTTTEKATKVNDFKTVFFQGLTVQIHNDVTSRVVVDKNNNIHILNS